MPTLNLDEEVVRFIEGTLNVGSSHKVRTIAEAVKNANVLTYIQKCVDDVNAKAISRVH